MLHQDPTISYCFNTVCRNSIFNAGIYNNAAQIPLETAISNNFNCQICGEELVAPILNRMKKSILELIKNEQSNIILLDDDVIFHHYVKRMFNTDLVQANYYTDGFTVLNELTFNIDHENTLPDIIFLDLNMPIIGGWDFLKLFKALTINLTKKIDVYIISNSIDPADHMAIEDFEFVKCFISKSDALEFFKMINAELKIRKVKTPNIILDLSC